MMLPVIDAFTTSVMVRAKRRDGDDELGGVAEGRVEKTSQRGPGAAREMLGGGADQPGSGDERYGGGDEHPDRHARVPPEPETDRGGKKEQVERASGDDPKHLGGCRRHGTLLSKGSGLDGTGSAGAT